MNIVYHFDLSFIRTFIVARPEKLSTVLLELMRVVIVLNVYTFVKYVTMRLTAMTLVTRWIALVRIAWVN